MHTAPGNPFTGEKALSPVVMAALKKEYGLDQPIIIQYFNYLKGILVFDFGISFHRDGIPVSEIIQKTYGPSAIIGALSSVFILLVGIPIGVIASLKHNKFVDRMSMFLSIIGVTVPSFVLATLFLYYFNTKLGWVPSFGVGSFKHYIGPALCISVFSLAFVTRLTRSSMLEVLQQDYIRTARAKGLNNFKVLFKHALRNALIPVVTYVGPMIAGLLTGSFVVERIFAIPGLGQNFTVSVTNRDYTLIMGMTMFYAVFLVVAIFLVDIVYSLIDPRIKYES
jgi:oligopeptide transport system permease protein